MIGSQLVDESDATAFLAHVEHQTLAFLVNHLHGAVQLFAAVALAGAEDVAGGAGGVHAHHHGFAVFPVALLEGQVGGAVVELRISNQLKITPLRWQFNFLFPADQGLLLQTVGNQFFDAGDGDAVFLSHFQQFGKTGHRAVRVDDFDEGAHGFEAGEFQQIDGSLGVACADQHTTVTGAQGVHVSRAAEVGGLHRLVGQRVDGSGAVVHGDARRATMAQKVNGHGEGGLVDGRVVGDLHLEVQLAAAFGGHGHAKHAASARKHEVHLVGVYMLRGDDKIALVLTLFIVNQNDEFSSLQILNGLFN